MRRIQHTIKGTDVNMKTGFIGTGNMGGALADAVSRAAGKGDSIYLCDRSAEKAAEAAGKTGGTVVALDELFAICDTVFFGVKPQGLESLAAEVMPALKKRIDSGSVPLAVTMAAGVSLERFGMLFPGLPAIRIMPNTPVSVGEGMIFWCAGAGVDDAARESFARIMSKAGRLSELPEGLIDAAGALSGCGPAFVYMFIDALADGGVAAGLPRTAAREAAIQTVLGAASLARESGAHPGELKDAVCSPGGTTIEGVRLLENRAFRSAVTDAVVAAYEKTARLSKK